MSQKKTLTIKGFRHLKLFALVVVSAIISGTAFFTITKQKAPTHEMVNANTATVEGAMANFISDKNITCKDCNILFIVVDTLTANRMSLYGHDRETTPYLDEYAKDATVFNSHFAQIPFTPPSHVSMLTGLYPITHLGPFMDKRGKMRELSTTLPILPIILEGERYKTAAFVSNPFAGVVKDAFQEYTLSSEMGEIGGTAINDVNQPNKWPNGFYETNNKAINWLRENGNEKFFLFLNYMDVHKPYSPIEAFDFFDGGVDEESFEYKAAKYDGEIRFVDHKINILLNELKKLNLEENTVVIITSDHGESFGEYTCKAFSGKNELCKEHPKSLYDPEIHVPLIIKIPGAKGLPERIDGITESVDLAPTLLEILDIEFTQKPDFPMEGTSLVPILAGLKRQENHAFSVLGEDSFSSSKSGDFASSLRLGDWKLIKNPGIENSRSQIYLYHKENGDRWEAIDVAAENPAIVKDLEIKMDEIINGKEMVYEEPDAETVELLKSLGYME